VYAVKPGAPGGNSVITLLGTTGDPSHFEPPSLSQPSTDAVTLNGQPASYYLNLANGTNATSTLGTNTATAGWVLRSSGDGSNNYWAAAGGGSGTVTQDVEYIYADSVPLLESSAASIEAYTNSILSVGLPWICFDKDTQEYVGPIDSVAADNFNSNVTLYMSSYLPASTADVVVAWRYYVPGDAGWTAHTSAAITVSAATPAAMETDTFSFSPTGIDPGETFYYEFYSLITNGTSATRTVDHRIQNVRIEFGRE
jgi:hypothetical protein